LIEIAGNQLIDEKEQWCENLYNRHIPIAQEADSGNLLVEIILFIVPINAA